MSIFSKAFWQYAGERAIKTFAQAVVGSLVGGTAAGAAGADWKVVLISALVSALVSVLTSITAYTGTNTDQPKPQPEAKPYEPEHAAPESTATAVFPQIDERPHEPASA